MKTSILLLVFVILNQLISAQSPYYHQDSTSIVIAPTEIQVKNKFVERTFRTDSGFSTLSFKSLIAGKDYSAPGAKEFAINLNGHSYSNKSFSFIRASTSEIKYGKLLTVELQGKEELIKDIYLTVYYWIYNDTPGIRKQIQIRNNSTSELIITNFDIESLKLVPADIYMTNVYANYGTNITRIPYSGDYYDPAILLYNEIYREGIILGNEAPGILKRTDCYLKDYTISIGLKKEEDDYPFKKYLGPGTSFSSPKTFILFSQHDKWQDCFEIDLGNFVRNNMGVKLYEHNSYPLFYYCSWIPFKTNINEKLIMDLADNLNQTGVEVLLIDDGWMDNWGDYNSHPVKFPGGIQNVCKYIHSKGLKPGMWFSIASINRSSEVYRKNKGWAVKDKNGKAGNVYCLDTFRVTMSMSSPWYDYIYGKISSYIEECDLAYVKLDFAIASSAYITDSEISGDYGSQNKHHPYKDQESSYWGLYQSAIQLFRDLKERFPDLIVDCTFEVWGKYHIIDYALIQNADVDWLTNYEFEVPRGPISIRQVTAERARVVPVPTMMIGNQLINSPNKNFTYQSLAAGTQLLCGDPRKLTHNEKKWYKDWSDWYRLMDRKYHYTKYYYRSDIFDYPGNNNWDGCYRLNPDKQGGILYFFRNGSLNPEMTFPITMLAPEKNYHIYEPCGGKDWGIYKGSNLINSGFTIKLENPFSSKVLGIEVITNTNQ